MIGFEKRDILEQNVFFESSVPNESPQLRFKIKYFPSQKTYTVNVDDVFNCLYWNSTPVQLFKSYHI